jgi:hypothetical protein
MFVTKFVYSLIFISLFTLQDCLSNPFYPVSGSETNYSDTLKEDQLLYVGRVWNNLYYKVSGDEFLFTSNFMNGSVSINGRYFKNVRLKYDIYTDALLTPTNLGRIINLNKEMVDSFSLDVGSRTYNFIRSNNDSSAILDGYYNVLYKGKSVLCVKYKKVIQPPEIDRLYFLFNELHNIFVIKDGVVYNVNTRRSLLNVFGAERNQVKKYINKNRLLVSKNDPDSYIPILKFYESLAN